MDDTTFLRSIPDLFERTRLDEGEDYDEVIYRVERPLRQGLVARVRRFVQAGDGDVDDGTPRPDIDEAVAESHYPDTSPLLPLADQGFDLPTAVGLLHFYQPAYPLYRRAAVAGLQELGRDVAWTTELSEKGLAAYRTYEQEIQDLTDRLLFRHTPEVHYYRQRVVEGALAALDGTA